MVGLAAVVALAVATPEINIVLDTVKFKLNPGGNPGVQVVPPSTEISV